VLSCEGQARLGHEVHLAFGPIYGPEGSMLGRVEAFNRARAARGEPGIGTHVVADLRREIAPRADRRALGRLGGLVRELRPDIVHTHSSKAGALGRLAAWRERERARARGPGWRCGIVHTVHGPPFMPVEGSVARRVAGRARNGLYAAVERAAARRCDVIVSVADAMTRQFRERGIGAPGQYVTVYSGMEVERYLEPEAGATRADVRARLGIGADEFVVGTVGRLAEHKGHDDVLTALGGELRGGVAWRLLWVGDGWWRGRLEERARRMGVAERVTITGMVPSESVAGMIRAMDVLAHPSAREGLPRAVPQALLCGVPVVAYDVDGTGEACVEGRTGRLVRGGDVAGLGAALRWTRENREEAAALAARGRELCRERFSAERMVRELEGVYARALAGARGESA